MKKKKSKKRIVLFILFIVLLYASGGIYYVLSNKKPTPQKVSNLDTIKGYKYTLKSNATNLYKTEFKNLKTNLESSSINEDEYINSIAKLFIIDLYTLSNKINKYDIETIYIHPDYADNYKLNVQNTLYKYIEDNSNRNRNQELPEVSTIEINSNEKTTFKIDETEVNAYKVKLSWNYIKDMGYDKEGEVILTKIDKYYYVIEKN